MEENKKILNVFGQIVAQEVFDNNFRFIKNDLSDLAMTEGYTNLFANMSKLEKIEIENYTYETIRGCLFDFLRIFEENTQFKLVYEEANKQVNLNEISEMLKSEPIIENGWIEKFSKIAH